MPALDLTVDALAVFRIVRFLQQDSLIDRPRNAVLSRLDATHPKLAELGACPWCISPYVAAGVIVARWSFPRAWPVAARVLALSAVTGLLSER